MEELHASVIFLSMRFYKKVKNSLHCTMAVRRDKTIIVKLYNIGRWGGHIMHECLMVDFGSTYTKVTAFDVDEKRLLGRAQSPTTIGSDVRIGLERALDKLGSAYGVDGRAIEERYACSSAAGGLRMTAIGLVPALTLEAARRAALGAGAKVVAAYGYEIYDEIVREIEELKCDIIMLCGGTDGGNKAVILHNAEMLADSQVDCPILVCGNKVVTGQVKNLLEAAGKRVYTAPNVLPEVNRVEVAPAQQMIREIFIEHIVRAKGLDKAADFFCCPIIPTPIASLHAAELLADGTAGVRGIGSLLIVEVGGATTNIHSVASIRPVTSQTIMRGLPDERVTRTVEGDLGIRYNARTIFDFVGEEALRQRAMDMRPGLDESRIDPEAFTALVGENVEYTPKNDEEYMLDAALAMSAAGIAVSRHAGTLHREHTVNGEVNVQTGKNLLEVKNVLGMGGIFKYGKMPEKILGAALFSRGEPWSLKPMNARGWIDSEYIMYAVGLLSQRHPDAALEIAKKYLRPVELECEELSDFDFEIIRPSDSVCCRG